MNQVNVICEYLGGSHSYGLSTPSSDIDIRGIYTHTDYKKVIGLDKQDHFQIEGEDSKYREFRSAMQLLKTGNSEMVEHLFQEDWRKINVVWTLVQKYRTRLIDSKKLFSVLRGYAQGELKLANGERTGQLGSKRKESIDKYGFSPKNFVQLYRLLWAGSIFFEKGYFPVNVLKEDESFGKWLLEVKTKPEKFSKHTLNETARVHEELLVQSFENRKFDYSFDDGIANDLICYVYAPVIVRASLNIESSRQF